MNFKKVWNDPVWSKVISAGILVAIGAAWASVHWLKNVQQAWSVSVAYLGGDVSLPRWAFVLMSLCVVGTFGGVGLLLLFSKTEPQLDWRGYNEDMFLGLRWRWKINSGNPTEISPFCPQCDYALETIMAGHDTDRKTVFICCNCPQGALQIDGGRDFIERRVFNSVQLALRNGNWTRANKTNPAA